MHSTSNIATKWANRARFSSPTATTANIITHCYDARTLHSIQLYGTAPAQPRKSVLGCTLLCKVVVDSTRFEN